MVLRVVRGTCRYVKAGKNQIVNLPVTEITPKEEDEDKADKKENEEPAGENPADESERQGIVEESP